MFLFDKEKKGKEGKNERVVRKGDGKGCWASPWTDIIIYTPILNYNEKEGKGRDKKKDKNNKNTEATKQ